MDSYSIPAAALEALGGLQEDDPPVLILAGDGSVDAIHPSESTPWRLYSDARILLPQSAPALLRVLARHWGWDGATGAAALHWMCVAEDSDTRVWVVAVRPHMANEALVSLPELCMYAPRTGIVPPMQALAEVFVREAQEAHTSGHTAQQDDLIAPDWAAEVHDV